MGATTQSPAKLSALSAARAGPCRSEFCGAEPGVPCTGDQEPDGDHFTRYIDAAKIGLIPLGAMQEVIAIANYMIAHPVIPAELAEDVPL
jgi:hypothetical protein